jgi:hypothetical protein
MFDEIAETALEEESVIVSKMNATGKEMLWVD